MSELKKTIIVRHRKENLKKCTLQGLETRNDLHFFSYPLKEPLPELSSYVLLTVMAPPLTPQDSFYGLLLIDATWRYAQVMEERLPLDVCQKRSLPSGFKTAYPRRQDDCPSKERGLASIEALYLAYVLSGRDPQGLLDNYYWKLQFLEKNREVLTR